MSFPAKSDPGSRSFFAVFNLDSDVTIRASTLLGYLFSASRPPPAPGPADCGVDPTPDDLGCPSFPPCR